MAGMCQKMLVILCQGRAHTFGHSFGSIARIFRVSDFPHFLSCPTVNTIGANEDIANECGAIFSNDFYSPIQLFDYEELLEHMDLGLVLKTIVEYLD